MVSFQTHIFFFFLIKPTGSNPLYRDRLNEAVTVHDFPTVYSILSFYKDEQQLKRNTGDEDDATYYAAGDGPSIDLTRKDDFGRSHLMVCGLDAQTSSKPEIDIACTRIVKALLNTDKYDADLKDSEHWRAIDYYASLGLPETVSALLDSKSVDAASLNDPHPESAHTTLHRAVINGNLQTVKLLIEFPSLDVNSGKGSDLGTPLLVAVRQYVVGVKEGRSQQQSLKAAGTCSLSGTCTPDLGAEPGKQYLQIIYALLSHPNTDVNAPTSTGLTPLMICVSLGSIEFFDAFKTVAGSELDFSAVDGRGFGVVSYSEGKELKNVVAEAVVERAMAKIESEMSVENDRRE